MKTYIVYFDAGTEVVQAENKKKARAKAKQLKEVKGLPSVVRKCDELSDEDAQAFYMGL